MTKKQLRTLDGIFEDPIATTSIGMTSNRYSWRWELN